MERPRQNSGPNRTLGGVLPIVATPFRADGAPDEGDLARVVEFIVSAGADGLVFPGVASEFETLEPDERRHLVEVVAQANRGRLPLVIGVSTASAAESAAYAEQARTLGAAAVMAMSPSSMKGDMKAIAGFYRTVAAVGVPVMLQNQAPPTGCALTMEQVAALIEGVPGIPYVKEEVMPCGQRIGALLALRPKGMLAVFGGAGGRYITDELARGAAGTMPACELVDMHVRQFKAHRGGDTAEVRRLFNRMLPLLNFQAVFRMAMTKEVLRRRGVIAATQVRAPGPKLDAGDQRELEVMLAELGDLLKLPAA
jgi:4-hydroxy-tetrahydrodipicolinate synthase